MAQLVVRNIPDEVKDRLKKRAEQHGRSLEAEVRDILSNVASAPAPTASKEGLGTELARKLKKYKLSREDWETFELGIAELRKNRRIGTGDLDP
ncbi:MAG: FitA-like ribbon-helix-helix domain-containing protein [Hyphomicrobium sp.]